LVDGEKLVDMLENLELGLSPLNPTNWTKDSSRSSEVEPSSLWQKVGNLRNAGETAGAT
jgi:hypothetical protein